MIDAEIREVNEQVAALGDLSQVDPKILDEIQDQIRVLLGKSALSHERHIATMEGYNAARKQTLQ